jgi:hypothetical protein
VTRDEAHAERDRLEREHPEREQLIFAVREQEPGKWAIVTARVDGLTPRGPLTAEIRARPQMLPDPAQDTDPRTHPERYGY